MSDSVVVFDGANQRVTVVGPDLDVERSVRVDGYWRSGVALDWPRVALNGTLLESDSSGRPFHILNVETGQIETSFGEGDVDRPSTRGLLALDSITGEIWSVMGARFRVQRWSPGGELPETLVAPERVFPRGGTGRMGNPRTPPDPIIMDFQFHDRALLVHYGLPRESWRDAWQGVTVTPHGAENPPSLVALFEGRMALVDVDSGQIMTVWPFDALSMGGGGLPGRVVPIEPTTDLFPTIAVRRLVPQW